MFTEIVENAMRTTENPGDYVKNGILYCGRCNTPKQTFVSLPFLTGTDEKKLVPVSCQCEKAEAERIEREDQEEIKKIRFRRSIEASWREDGFHDSSYLNPKFDDDDGSNKKLTEVCKRYVSNWDKMYENGMGILLYGGVGAGKSFLAGCVCNALLEKRVRICATSFPRVLNVLQNLYERKASLDRLAKYQLVLLDDFGVERGTEYAQEQLFSVVDARYRAKKPTIITTNLSIAGLENPQNMSYARIFDRILELCPIRLCASGTSKRKKLAEERRKLAKELLS